MGKHWSQPRLDGGALRHFHVTADFRWPAGWQARVWIIQEGAEPATPICVASATDVQTPDVLEFLRTISQLLEALD